jgi:hypothetical protein
LTETLSLLEEVFGSLSCEGGATLDDTAAPA